MRTRRWVAGAVGGLVTVIAAAGVTARVYRLAWRPPVYQPREAMALAGTLRTWAEHDEIRAAKPEPYITTVDAPGALLYFGTGHTRDPESPFIGEIEQQWAAFRPTVALCEGRTRFFFFAKDSGVRQFGEPAVLLWLSRRDNVPLYSLEPAYSDEVSRMLEQWTPDRVAAYYTLRVFWGEKQGHDPAHLDDLAAALLTKRSDVNALRGCIAGIPALDALWGQWFPDGPDWRALDTEPEGSFLADMSDRSREVRAEHMVRALTDLCRQGERVFAVVGSGHVIRQEPMILATLHPE